MSGIRLHASAVPPGPVVPYVRQDGTDSFGGFVTQRIYSVPATGGNAGANAAAASSPSSGNYDKQPEVSRSGRKIAFSRNGADIRIVDLDTMVETFRVNFDEGSTFGINSRHRWRRDDAKLVFADNEQTPSRVTLYSLPAASGTKTLLKQWTPGVGIGDFGYAFDSDYVMFRDPVTKTLWYVLDDGTGATDTGLSIDATNTTQYMNRLTPGFVSDVVVYVDQTAGEIRKCALDGTGDTLVATLGPNQWRFSNHILSGDDSFVAFVYDTNNYNNQDGYWTSEIGKDSQIYVAPLDGSGPIATGIWTFMEGWGGNLGNNPCDTPHVYGNRIYCSRNVVNDGGDYPSGDSSHYRWGSFLADGSGWRIEDEFDISGPGTPETWDAAWARITMEEAIAG